MKLTDYFSEEELLDSFPDLNNNNHEITSVPTIEYNCIAWAAGDNTKWWWPIDYYWPDGIERKETRKSFIEAFQTLGYEECEHFDFEIGYEKIAIYFSSNGKPTHASKQLDETNWSSKLGNGFDISHHFEAISEGFYGNPEIIMKRPKP